MENMKTIDTSQKGWQKQMAASMKRKKRFTLLTSDEKFANALEKGKFNVGVMKLILFGSGALGTGAAAAGAAIAGLSGAAKLAAASALFAIANPEAISKVVLALISLIGMAVGCYFIFRLVKMLIQNKYKFRIKKKGPSGEEWEIEGEPA